MVAKGEGFKLNLICVIVELHETTNRIKFKDKVIFIEKKTKE